MDDRLSVNSLFLVGKSIFLCVSVLDGTLQNVFGQLRILLDPTKNLGTLKIKNVTPINVKSWQVYHVVCLCQRRAVAPNREKSLHHVAMVAKLLDDNKSKIHLKSKFTLYQTSLALFNFIQLVKCWRNFLGLNPKGPPSQSLEKEKETFCVVFPYSVKQAREIKKFHVTVMQPGPNNVQKLCMCKFVILLI